MEMSKGHAIKYTKEEEEWLKENCKGVMYKDLAHMFNQRFNKNLKPKNLSQKLYRMGLRNGVDGRFSKGLVPWNKGLKGYMGPNETSFKKGDIPVTKKPIGSTRVDVKDGYLYVKTKEPAVWELAHRVEYEKYHNVKLTSEDVIIFLDGNKLNLEKDNLELVTRAELLAINRNQLLTTDQDLSKTGVLIGKLISKTHERKSKK